MKLKKIVQILGNEYKNIPEIEINWLFTDSRTFTFPDESLFFAIRTSRNDGHKYIEELYRQQVRYFVVNEIYPEYRKLKDAVFILVEDTLNALQKLVVEHRKNFEIPVIGITGSNGKTVVKEWLNQLLHQEFSIVRSPRSYNSQIGVALSVWALNKNTQLGIFEAGISQPGEMERLEPIIKPSIGIFTNLGDAHQENFHSLKEKCEEKLKLFKNSDVLIYNSDNRLVDISVAQSGFKGKLFSWGTGEKSELQLVNLLKNNGKTSLSLKYKNEIFSIDMLYADNASVENAINCIATMLYLNYSVDEISRRILLLETVAMRLEVKEGNHNCLIINDSYNSDLNSIIIALDFLNQQASSKNLKRTLILSDILQSGQTSDSLYKTVADLIRNKNVQNIIGIGPEISKHTDKFSFLTNTFYSDTESFLKSPVIHEFQNEIILLKGSRKFHFEDISVKIEKIAHETILEVNLNALIENLNYFRSRIRPETQVICMVKAFAYGSGAVEVARTLQHHRCNVLAVAVADEGVELRREGIRIPIMVMNPEKGSFGLIFDNNLEPEIYSFRLLDAFIASAARLGITDYPIHIKIDSGMHRLGFEKEDIEFLIEKLKKQNQVKVRSVFSHLAGADDSKFDAFTNQQAETFKECADLISLAFSHHIMFHLLNSAGIERFPEFQYEMVRLGIGLYGISTLPNIHLKQVCALKTIILQTKDINPGETIGYSRKGIVNRKKRIAILPIGYADGFDRKLSNGVGEVIINGKRVQVIGNVSMDLITVDITGIDAKEGDVVEIFGDNITISEIANKLNTIPYEVLTGISRRVKRVYFQE